MSSVSISFTDDRHIHELNLQYRGKDKATDVLSFSLTEGDDEYYGPSLGDVVISLDTAKMQAKRYGVSLSCEVLRLLIHGLLHLTGFDHEGVPAREATRMRRRERRFYSELSAKAKGLVLEK